MRACLMHAAGCCTLHALFQAHALGGTSSSVGRRRGGERALSVWQSDGDLVCLWAPLGRFFWVRLLGLLGPQALVGRGGKQGEGLQGPANECLTSCRC